MIERRGKGCQGIEEPQFSLYEQVGEDLRGDGGEWGTEWETGRVSPSPHLPVTPSPVTPSPHLPLAPSPVTPSPHLPLAPSPGQPSFSFPNAILCNRIK
jgi:hypothetical protein